MVQHQEGPIPKQMRPVHDTVVGLTDAFCEAHLNEEYAQLCRKLTAALSRKRPSPLARGKVEVWACAIVYAIGRVNFLFDKSQTPYMSAGELCKAFGVSNNTASARATMILDTFGIMLLDPRWSLPSKLGDNPLAWLITVNGLIIDARYAPRDIQEEALRLGLIPYLPEQH
jgi:hypothetical protein